jgi:hypothetical protein
LFDDSGLLLGLPLLMLANALSVPIAVFGAVKLSRHVCLEFLMTSLAFKRFDLDPFTVSVALLATKNLNTLLRDEQC